MLLFPPDILQSAQHVVDLLKAKKLRVTTAESCTGGLVAGAITSIAGSSDVFDAGFVTYADEAKSKMIGVPKSVIATHGAVSSEVAGAMAEAARQSASADLAVAVTGIAGPGGGSLEKPVGLVFIAVAGANHDLSVRRHEFGAIGRQQIRLKSVREALNALAEVAT